MEESDFPIFARSSLDTFDSDDNPFDSPVEPIQSLRVKSEELPIFDEEETALKSILLKDNEEQFLLAEKPVLREVELQMTDLNEKRDILNESGKSEEDEEQEAAQMETEQMVADDASCCHEEPEDNISMDSTQYP